MLTQIITLGFLATTQAISLKNVPRDTCKPCSPEGATGTTSPSFGPDLKNLYIDVLASVDGIHFRKRNSDGTLAPRVDGFCCHESLDCVNIQNLNVPMCYDKFTTNYQLPDGAYGSLTTGDFTSGASKANLLTGEYTEDGGESGNIYADDPAAKPNTATMSIPPQFTATGVGSAIPASEIGGTYVETPSASVNVNSHALATSGAALTTLSGSTGSPGSTASSPSFTGNPTVTPGSQGAVEASFGANAAGSFSVELRSLGVSIVTGLIYLLYAF